VFSPKAEAQKRAAPMVGGRPVNEIGHVGVVEAVISFSRAGP
jgi:hypothetical protein